MNNPFCKRSTLEGVINRHREEAFRRGYGGVDFKEGSVLELRGE